MNNKISITFMLVFSSLLFFLSSCKDGDAAGGRVRSLKEGKNENASQLITFESDKPNAAASRDNAEDTLIVGIHASNGDFLPAYYGSVADKFVVNLVFTLLISNNEKGETVPDGVERWEYSNENRTITFFLPDNITFFDGSPLTAHDVKFTYELLADPAYDGRYPSMVDGLEGYEEYHSGDAEEVSGIKVINDYTVSFTFIEAKSTNLLKFGDVHIMPRSYYKIEKGDIASLKEKMHDLMGSGRYKMVKYVPGQYIELEANENYYKGAPKIKNMILKYTTPETELQELEKGTVDVQTHVPPRMEKFELVKKMGVINIAEYPYNGYGYMGFNLRDERLADRAVREALVVGFNRKQFAEVYYQGYAQVCNSPMSPVSWATTDELMEKLPKYEYNTEKANQILEEAGWKMGSDGVREKEGKRLEFTWDTYTNSKYVEALIPMLEADWKKIGVKVTPNLMDFGSLVTKIYTKRDFELYNMAWSQTPDPDGNRTTFHSKEDIPDGNNSIGYRNEKVDGLLVEGETEFDRGKRIKIYEEFALELTKDLPYMFISQNMEWDLINERVLNLQPTPFCDWTYFIEHAELAK